tara:strand:+ start:1476 stop:1964 length:489 start_codon:yes stop_codon:yes gene_type:complete
MVYKLTERAKADLAELEQEVNHIVSKCKEIDDFNLRTSENKKDYCTAMQLMCIFVETRMHRFEPHQRTRALAEWFDRDRTTILHHFKHARARLDADLEFQHMWAMLGALGIKCATEGWIRSHELRIRFIDRQISILKDRREKIENKQQKGWIVTTDDLSLQN